KELTFQVATRIVSEFLFDFNGLGWVPGGGFFVQRPIWRPTMRKLTQCGIRVARMALWYQRARLARPNIT
ncbi:hypothetical protein G3N28_22825, partial [Desulfobacter hydrogenophilus]|nr:hypothetical protein [Desulfobacter hydrogenophilus]